MSACLDCSRKKAAIIQYQGHLIHAAKRAANNPSAKNIAAIEKAKADLEYIRWAYNDHLEGFHADEAVQ